MGTTLTAAWWIPPMLYFAHVGHSRLYLLRGGRLTRLTKDHTVAAGMTEAGFEEAKAAGFEHVLTQALGGDLEGVNPEAGCRRLHPGDVLLLCTDGLLRGVDEDHITRVLEEVHSAADAAARPARVRSRDRRSRQHHGAGGSGRGRARPGFRRLPAQRLTLERGIPHENPID